MNRTVRRAEEQKERRQEREKAKAKAEARKRREERRAMARKRREERAAARAAGSADGAADAKESGADGAVEQEAGPPKRRGSNPGRFAGVLLFATVFFISLQAVAPSGTGLAEQAVSASFYLLFGYFAALWMHRRGTQANPVPLVVIAAALMGAVSGVSQWLQPALEPLPLLLALTVPLAFAGAKLGDLVWRRAP